MTDITKTDKPLTGEYIKSPKKPFKCGDYVTRTGSDIQLVTELDNECYFGTFKCVYDQSGIYEIGESEQNMAARYNKITEISDPELYNTAIRINLISP